jgi:hypothetical protein
MVRLRLDRRLQGRVDSSDVLQEAHLGISRDAVVRPEGVSAQSGDPRMASDDTSATIGPIWSSNVPRTRGDVRGSMVADRCPQIDVGCDVSLRSVLLFSRRASNALRKSRRSRFARASSKSYA